MESNDAAEPARPQTEHRDVEHLSTVRSDGADADVGCAPPQQSREPLSAQARMPEAFREVVQRLDYIDERAVSDHAEAYDAVHRDLRAALDDVDRTG